MLNEDGLIPGLGERAQVLLGSPGNTGCMARSRFVGDAGLTVRMTTVMFLLGALFVALVVGSLIVGLWLGPGLGARHRRRRASASPVYQWCNSDKVAMRAMRRPRGDARSRRPSCTA